MLECVRDCAREDKVMVWEKSTYHFEDGAVDHGLVDLSGCQTPEGIGEGVIPVESPKQYTPRDPGYNFLNCTFILQILR